MFKKYTTFVRVISFVERLTTTDFHARYIRIFK